MRSVIKACLVDGFGAGAVSSLNVSSGVATASLRPIPIGSGRWCWRHAGGPERAAARAVGGIGLDHVRRAAGWTVQRQGRSPTRWPPPAGKSCSWASWLTPSSCSPLCPRPLGVCCASTTRAATARVVGYESASDINTGTGPFPTAAQVGGGLYWPKSGTASSAARTWRCIASSRWLLLWIAPMDGATHGCLFAFGDVLSYRSADAYGCALRRRLR